jgi:4-hydroxy-3-methylbut-2-en-1-yl diphosphate synthase IspG/GcpE
MADREKVTIEIEDALSGNLAKAGHIYRMSLNGLKDKALKDALDLLKELKNETERNPVIVCPHCGKRVK